MSTDAATREMGGDLGYITVFTLPYIFENVAYQINVNNYSKPFRSALGYHIFKNLGERKPLGSRKVSQILFALPPNASAQEKMVVQRKADSVYQLLQQGSAFGPMARLVSNDIASASNNGELPEFGIGEYDPVFEQAVYALQKEGDMSKPIETGFGFHIIRLDRFVPVETNKENIEARALLQNKVQKDARLELARKKMLETQLKSIGYKPSVYNKTDLWRFTDSMLAQKRFSTSTMNDKTVLFSFARKKITAADWAEYVQMKRAITTNFAALLYTDLIQEFTTASSTEYYRTHLEDFSPSYKQQVQEFKEANMLFGVMDKHVWGKANTDTIGLKAYYSLNKQKYKWEPSADALVITCMSDSIVSELETKLAASPEDWRNIIEPYGERVNADSGRFELGQLPVVDRTNFQPKLVTAPVKNEPEQSVTFNYIIRLHEGGQPRNFEDAKGVIISDYQQVLENKWIAQLKKKYPVKINKGIFDQIK
jgi:peptidyl-prolyl cis-trans isomerase SurA